MWTDICTYLVILAVMLMSIYFKNYIRSVYLAFQLSGPPAVPLIGNVLLMKNDRKLEEIAEKMSEMYSPFMRCWLSIFPVFFIYEPKALQLIMGTNRYTSKNIFYNCLHNVVGDGLITSSGEIWKQHRKLIQPYFHISVLKVYFDIFHKWSMAMVQDLENETEVNITKYANKFVFDVQEESILGISGKRPESSPYRGGQFLMLHRITRPWLLFNTIFKRTDFSKVEENQKNILQQYTKSILDGKKQNSHGTAMNNLMEMMMEISNMNPEFTDDDIVNETCTFMLAGQDSVGAALSFALYSLAAHQDIQEKVVQELNGIFKDGNQAATFEDVAEMKYLEQCIKETLRLYPSVPMITRKITEDVPLGKYTLPTGTNIVISPFVTHRLPHVFPDPLKFDPDRFSPENKAKIHPYGFIPFSAGPRNCIGYKFAIIELKTVLSQILRKYHVSLVPGREKLILSYRMTLKAKKGIWLRLKKRSV
ncbi:probable cytochrome P450 4aa1 [Tribolium castaneum]|uniref:probable cytochrome P450 4aa1 n=1 Tax=Tribolium castaneum TaxID=7070 RepID=UPI0030FE94D5